MNQVMSSIRRSWKHHFGLQLATLTVMAASLFTVVIMTSLYLNLESILTTWGQNLQMTVYLDSNASQSEIDQIQTYIEGEQGVASSEYVDSGEAMQRFQSQIGTYAPGLFTEKELAGLVPSSFELRLAENVMSNQPIVFMKDLTVRLMELSGIEEVSYGQDWVSRYSSMVEVLFYVGSFLVGLLMLGGIFVTGNSIRVAMNQRREEIEILELIGATQSMIRRPFIFEGAVMGFLSSFIALTTAYVLFWLVTNAFQVQLAFMGLRGQFELLPWSLAGAILILGTIVGALGAWLCVLGLNDGWSASQRAVK